MVSVLTPLPDIKLMALLFTMKQPRNRYSLKPEGMLLLDSGAQYLDGTTDITRTIVLGALRKKKTDYTLVLKGFIQLSMAQFPHGTCGTQLDALARLLCGKPESITCMEQATV